MKVTLGYSPCPNDTFIFHAISNKLVTVEGYEIEAHLHDVETLNRMAFEKAMDITKLSFYAWMKVKECYSFIQAGGALGYGCGPIVVSRRKFAMNELSSMRIVLPGKWTTAHLLFQLWAPSALRKRFVHYSEIIPLLESGDADCGVIIHESRFTFQSKGFMPVVDLGAWWERIAGLPIPLGCIAVRKNLPMGFFQAFENAIRKSIDIARKNPEPAMAYVKGHARELDACTLQSHIGMFVNDFSMNLGKTGRAAIQRLEEMAASAGVL